MKIGVLASCMQIGGAERQLALLANAMAARGHEVHLVFLTGDEADDYFPLRPEIRVTYLRSGADSRSLFEALRNGVGRLARVVGAFLGDPPQLLLALLPEAMAYAALASLRLRVPLLVSQRNNPARGAYPRRWQMAQHVAFRLASAIVFQTERARESAGAGFARKAAVIPNVVETPSDITPDPDAKVVVAAGRLVRQKGFDVLIQAFHEIGAAHPDWRLRINGEGPERPALEALVKSLSMSGRIDLPGTSGRPLGWLRGGSIFALSSRFEGYPNVLAEAMAHGFPVVAVDCDFGPGEIIEDGVNGRLVKPGDVSAFAQALGEMISNSESAARMSVRARDIVATHSVDQIVDRWLSLISDLVQRQPGKARR